MLEKSEILVERFPREMKILLETWSKSNERGAGQLVALADRWNPDFSILCRSFKLAVVITNMLEAVVYSRFQVLPTFISSTMDEGGELVTQMKSVVANVKGSVIVCCSSSQVLPHISLTLASYHQVVLKSTSLEELTRLWPFRKKQSSEDAGDRNLVIITDAALAVLTSANIVLPAQNLTLVHWDLPAGGRKAFERRFCLLRSAIPNIHLQSKETQREMKVHLLLRPHDAPSLNTIMDFLRRSNAKVPEELEVFHSGAMFAREKRQQLCSMLVQVML